MQISIRIKHINNKHPHKTQYPHKVLGDRTFGNICSGFWFSLPGSHTCVCARKSSAQDRAQGSRVAGSSERHTYIISQDCCAVEDGHRVLLLIVVELFMNLEEKQEYTSSPASKQ